MPPLYDRNDKCPPVVPWSLLFHGDVYSCHRQPYDCRQIFISQTCVRATIDTVDGDVVVIHGQKCNGVLDRGKHLRFGDGFIE